MDAERAALIGQMLKREIAKDLPNFWGPGEPKMHTVETMMARTEDFRVQPGADPRGFLEGVCVREGEAWACDGPQVICLPVHPDTPAGLHKPGVGWAEKNHDFPDIGAAFTELFDSTVWICSGKLLRALAELAVAHETDEQWPVVGIRIGSKGAVIANVLLVASGSPSRTIWPDVCIGMPSTDAESVFPVDLESSHYDARRLIRALSGSTGPILLGRLPGKFSPLILKRYDGEEHLLSPLRHRDSGD